MAEVTLAPGGTPGGNVGPFWIGGGGGGGGGGAGGCETGIDAPEF